MKNQKTIQNYTKHKGFTLVELIVVIVILAILAAILIPGLLKWIDKAREKKYEAEARNIYLAVEASLAQRYAQGHKDADGDITIDSSDTSRLPYIREMSGIDNITWMRIYIKDNCIKAINVNYVSPSDGTKVKAYRKENGYTSTETDFEKWFVNGNGGDGLWHFCDSETEQPIS